MPDEVVDEEYGVVDCEVPESDLDLDGLILQAIKDGKSVTVDGVSYTQHSLLELLAARSQLKSEAAAKTPNRGLKFTKLLPPAAISGR